MNDNLDRRQASAELADALHLLMPMHFFYEKNGQALPDFQFMDRHDMPYPYRSLLVHENDMTPTLAAFYHSNLSLEVHELERTDNYLLRLVSLRAVTDGQPVEFGAIGIQLDSFAPEIRELIVQGKAPLGGILGEHEISHFGKPAAFFSLPADQLVAKALKQEVGETLYGRCNQLVDADGMVLADIVEILPRHEESEQWIENG